ncbi:MAG: tetratricopeptide repeat protein [Candidatus Eisenbacteria bacterium]|uniref:Tetratricopeptide repeat protein n=1 Tax=Eiseniibacteriota bacterium TaxID=2212470 RepID=A0A538U2V8_UNCEI|nr:MAG: tetratricopeptide repeat protein [Candidatus Eisenbacteria bacterium]
MIPRRARLEAALVLIAGLLAGTTPAAAQTAGRPRPASPPPPDSTATARPGPTLFVPARQDSAPPESPPAPLLIPGRASPEDTSRSNPEKRAHDAFALGRQLEAQGAPGAAIVSYLNAVKFDPTLPDAHYRIAMLFLTRDQLGEAAKHLAAEVEHHPKNEDAVRQLGLCLARMGDSERAIRSLERLARHSPREGENWRALGFAYLAAKRPREAEAALRRALRLPPATVEERRDLGAALGALGRDAEARVQYRLALALAPTDAPTWLNLGNLERRAGRRDSALACYRRAEASDSSFALALKAQTQVLRELNRDDEAVDAYRRWLTRHPDHHGTRLEAVQLLEELGRSDEALALARDGTRQRVDSGQPHVILALVLRGRGDTPGALVELRRAEALYHGNPPEREKVRKTIAAMRAAAPDSLRAIFDADSVAASGRRK